MTQVKTDTFTDKEKHDVTEDFSGCRHDDGGKPAR
jgi:hypothetical protein